MSTLHGFIGLVLLLLASCGSGNLTQDPFLHSQTKSDNIVSTYLHDVGQGYNSLSEKALSWCLEDTRGERSVSAGGQNVTYHIQLVKSARELRESLGISAAASFDIGLNKGSANINIMNQTDFSKNSSYLAVRAFVRNAVTSIRQPRLKPEFLAYWREDPEGFRETCGDGFIQAMISGGSVIGLIEIEETSENDLISLQMEGEASGTGWSAKAKLEHQLSSLADHKQINIKMQQRGGIGTENATCENLSCLLHRIHDLSEIVKESGSVPIEFDISSYKTALTEPLQGRSIDIEYTQSLLSRLADARDDWQDMRVKYNRVLKTYNQSVFLEQQLSFFQKMIDAIAICDENIDNLQQAGRNCILTANDLSCRMPSIHTPKMPPPQLKLPQPPARSDHPVFDKPMYRFLYHPMDGCSLPDVIHSAEDAFQRWAWASYCGVIPRDDLENMRYDVYDRDFRELRDRSFYPVFTYRDQNEKLKYPRVWKPDITPIILTENYEQRCSAIGFDESSCPLAEESSTQFIKTTYNCYIPSQVIWYTVCQSLE